MSSHTPSPRSDEKTLALILEAARVPHEIIAVGEFARTAEEAARNLHAPLASIVKSLVCVADGTPLVAMVPGDKVLSFEKLDLIAGAHGAKLAGRRVVEAATGYVVGGVAPIGLPPEVPLFGESSILDLETIYCGAGSLRHMLRIEPRVLESLIEVRWADLCS